MTSKTLIYKVARFNRETGGKTLQDMLAAAIQKRKTATSRRQVGNNKNDCRLINYIGPHKSMRVGEFFDYTHGHRQPLAKLDDKAEELEITSLAPPDKMSEFLHSILYFGIWNNSVILSQSRMLRSSHFEAYINWLLTECHIFDEDDFVALADHPPLSMQTDVANTKGIEFHAPIGFTPTQTVGEDIKETKSMSFKPEGVAWNILRDLLPKELTLPKELKTSDIVLNSALEVTLTLSWSRLRKDDSTALLDRISNQLRHVDTELDYTIHTRSGKVTKDDFKLSRPISVGVRDDGLIKKKEMWQRMEEWLEILISEDKIVVDT